MKHWYLPTLLVFALAAGVAIGDYLASHPVPWGVYVLGMIVAYVLVCIGIGTAQGIVDAWRDRDLPGGAE